MAKKDKHVSETPATAAVRERGIVVQRTRLRVRGARRHGRIGGQLGVDEHAVVKTLVMQGRSASR